MASVDVVDTPVEESMGPGSWNEYLQLLGAETDNADLGIISEINTDFMGPDAIHWNRPCSLGVMMDAAALACGLRIVRDIDATVSAVNFSDSQTTYQDNIAPLDNPLQPSGQLICGGDFSSVHKMGSQPGGVEIIFTPHPRDRTIYGAYVGEMDSIGIPSKIAMSTDVEASGGFTGGGYKQFFTTARAVDDPAATKFAKAVAKDFYGWKNTAFDLVYAGIKPWSQTGFDDAVEWRFDWAPELADPESGYKGGYALQTRVQSLPANCGFSDLPQVIDFEGWRTVVVKLLEPLPPNGAAKASIQKGNPITFTWKPFNPDRQISVVDGLGLCEAAPIGTMFYAQEYPGIGYMATAAHCPCPPS